MSQDCATPFSSVDCRPFPLAGSRQRGTIEPLAAGVDPCYESCLLPCLVMKIGFIRSGSVLLAGVALIAANLPGCAGKPIWLDVVALNPVVREKWQQDEQSGPTFYAKRDELRAIRGSAAGLPAAQQEQLAQQLGELLDREPNGLLRREAVLTLGFLSTPGAGQALKSALSDPDADVRVGACRAWGRRGGPQAPSLLAEVVGSDQDVDVRMAAVVELGKFRGQIALNALAIALDDSDPALQFSAIQSLRQVGDRDYGNSVYAWREYLRGNNPPVPRPSLVERMTKWF